MFCPYSISHFSISPIYARHAHRTKPSALSFDKACQNGITDVFDAIACAVSGGYVDGFASRWFVDRVAPKTHVVRQEDLVTDEIILLDGLLAATICDPDGKEVCVGLYVGPSVVTPVIARTRAQQSLVSVTAITDTKIAQIDSDKLTQLMISSEAIRDWANGALRDALSQKADREWCLAALGGSDRLTWFRETYPGYEDIFNHALIASFLGITPVTLSRLRHK